MAPKKKKRKFRFRLLIALLFFGVTISLLAYNLYRNLFEIKEVNTEKSLLNKQLSELKGEEEKLQTDILKLEDPAYIAKYAQEKYLYTRDGEYVLRIQE